MLAGFVAPQVTPHVGLMSVVPAALVSVIIAAATVRHTARGALRTGWICLAVAVALYFLGTAIGTVSWLRGQAPFPGPADIMFLAFYAGLAASVAFLLRTAAVRVP